MVTSVFTPLSQNAPSTCLLLLWPDKAIQSHLQARGKRVAPVLLRCCEPVGPLSIPCTSLVYPLNIPFPYWAILVAQRGLCLAVPHLTN